MPSFRPYKYAVQDRTLLRNANDVPNTWGKIPPRLVQRRCKPVAVFISREKHLRVMSYNIFHGVGQDNKLNLSRTAQVIKNQKVDIVGLQVLV